MPKPPKSPQGLIEVSRCSHVYRIHCEASKKEQWVFLCPDAHWDNPKCNRELLKRHLDEAVALGARIIMPGDTFCLMQGKYDPRGSKKDVRPEHNTEHYFDKVIESAAEWFAPYQPYIDVVGHGNHETSVSKRMETSVIGRFVTLLNAKATGTHRVKEGGYGGWYSLQFAKNEFRKSYKVKYFHGSGGGAPVTKGTIEHNRQSMVVEGADCIVMGHVHNDYEVTYVRESLDTNLNQKFTQVLMVRCSTYKDEYGDGKGGWSVEKGLGPRPLGGRFMCLNFDIGWTAKAGAKGKPPAITAWTRKAV